ncbi:MAG TPA: type VII secretion target [Pseudonocardiaceae bacterium]
MAGRQRFEVDPAALSEYSARMATLAADVRQVAATHLAGNRSVPADAFGDVGREAGVHTALAAAINQLHDHVHATATTVADLGTKVGVAHNDYAFDEQDKAERFRGMLTE